MDLVVVPSVSGGRWVNRFVDLTLGLESDCKRYSMGQDELGHG